MRHPRVWIGLITVLAGCEPQQRAAQRQSRETPPSAILAGSTGYVDSAIPIAEALQRFRAGLPSREKLEGGYPTRDKLVGAFVRAVERRDTASLRRMVIGKGEFAWLYYPSSPLSRPPYELAPELMWFQLQGESEKGASRLLAERAGRPLGYLGHDCGPARTEGTFRIHPNCELRRVTASGDTVAERLFGLIVERDGSYKFIGYANTLD